MKLRTVFPVVFILVLLCSTPWLSPRSETGVADAVLDRGGIQLKSGFKRIQRMQKPDIERVLTAASAGREPVLIHFSETPTRDQMNDIKTNGIEVLHSIGRRTLLVRVAGEPGMIGTVSGLMTWAGTLGAEDKISKPLQEGRIASWAREGANRARVFIVFFNDVDPVTARTVVLENDLPVRYQMSVVNAILTAATPAELRRVASRPEVSWIEQVTPCYTNFMDQARPSVEADFVQAPPMGLDGAGVTVMVYEANTNVAPHPDYEGRVTNGDELIAEGHHSAMVAGIIGGDGTMERKYCGIAPAVEMVSYTVDSCALGQIPFVDTNCEMEQEFLDAIDRFDIDIANLSMGINICEEAASDPDLCDLYSDYRVGSILFDELSRGKDGRKPILIVCSAGNERGCTNCGDLDNKCSIGPSATGKNIITVGAINSNDRSMTPFSSWGPLESFRQKPELVAPGCQSDGDEGITATFEHGIPPEYYWTDCGTSFSAPIVSGCAALLYQKMREMYPAEEPLPSTVKAVLINTCRDLGDPGYDKKFGFGEVNADAAVHQLESDLWGTSTVSNGVTDTIDFYVEPDDESLCVTVSWPDPPAWDGATWAIQNYISIRLVSPTNAYHDNSRSDNTLKVAIRGADLETGNWRLLTIGNMVSGAQTYSYAIYSPTPKPEVTVDVIEPNGGEMIPIGKQVTIEWDVSGDINDIDVFHVGYEEGDRYESIAVLPGTDRDYELSVPLLESEYCRVSITAVDDEGRNIGIDSSDDYFTIYHQKTEWTPDGVPLHATEYRQCSVKLASDGAGGAIVLWYDGETGSEGTYAQRINADGDFVWNDPLFIGGGPISLCKSSADGYIAVVSGENYKIVAQKFDADGNILWDTNPTVALEGGGPYESISAKSDGAGGVLICAGTLAPIGFPRQRVIQKIDSNGQVLWDTGGVEIATTYDHGGGCQYSSTEVDFSPNANGGAIVVYSEFGSYPPLLRASASDSPYVYLTIINQAGSIILNERLAGTSDDEQALPACISDGSGGAFIVWSDWRPQNGLYLQRVNAAGDRLLAPQGVRVTQDGSLGVPKLHLDNGDLVITFSVYEEAEVGISAVKTDSDGQPLWNSPRTLISGEACGELDAATYMAGSGFFLVKNVESGTRTDLFVEKRDVDADYEWEYAFCTAEGYRHNDDLTTDGAGGVILGWTDHRDFYNGMERDTYLQRLKGDPSIPACTVTASIRRGEEEWSLSDMQLRSCPAGDFGYDVQFPGTSEYELVVECDFDDAYMVGTGGIPPEDIVIDMGDCPFSFCGPTDEDVGATSENGYTATLIRKYVTGASEHAQCEQAYDIPVRLNGDEIGTITDLAFRNVDLTGDGHVNLSDLGVFGLAYPSDEGDPEYNCCCDFNADGSVNLSEFSLFSRHYLHECPAASQRRQQLAVSDLLVSIRAVEGGDNRRIGMSLEHATPFKVLCFGIVNEDPSMKFARWIPPEQQTVRAAVLMATIQDQDILFVAVFGYDGRSGDVIDLGTLDYTVTESANGSDHGGEVSMEDAATALVLRFGEVMDPSGKVSGIANIENGPDVPVYTDRLWSGYPNPFNPATTIEYSISADSYVNLSVYNVKGELVRVLVDGFQKQNRYKLTWDGRNDDGREIASGVYFCRIKTETFTSSKKLIMLR